MDDLILRAAAIGCLGNSPEQMCMPWSEVERMLRELPAVDAAPVVRCHKCIHWDRETVRQNSNDVGWWNEAICERHTFDGLDRIEKWTDADWFCADGERRDDDAACGR